MRRSLIAGLLAGIFTAALFVFSPRADAYAITGSSPTSSFGSSYSVMAPFVNFFQSLANNLTSAGTIVPVSLNPAEEPAAKGLQNDVRNILGQFDAWLYGIAGFHVLNFFTALLSIFSWLLGGIKSGVDWILGFMK